jgi:hypothetical protein
VDPEELRRDSFEGRRRAASAEGGVLRALAYVDCEEVEQEIGVGSIL